MVFIGGWSSGRRRGFRPYGGYGPYRGYGYGPGRPGNSCMRDICLIQSGCCLAELVGCGPQLALLAPSLVRRSARAARQATGSGAQAGAGAPWLLGFALAAIRLYQQEISPRRRPCCRYSPTCSQYAAEALQGHGLRRGLWLAGRRLLRCRPGSAGGSDPVPAARTGHSRLSP
ncbi:MAG TPA: membrane protein insertion efficiency factor YidD [Jatrophihabitans sp.]|uniref:membrane protein insertion efficiency factor YidD n=1 Tax=Jatrophihabitans sp. TaxID=1932789 RepID=UPI002EE8E3D8